MSNNLDALYKRWCLSKDSVLQEVGGSQNSFSSRVLPTYSLRRSFESAGCHVNLQSDEFYHIMRVLSHGNSSSLNILDFLAKDLNVLRVELFVFGERYLGDWPAIKMKSSMSDWRRLAEMIVQRIALEESQLGPLLKRGQKVGCQE